MTTCHMWLYNCLRLSKKINEQSWQSYGRSLITTSCDAIDYYYIEFIIIIIIILLLLLLLLLVCVCSNANPLHDYVLRVPRKVDRWR